TLDGCRNRSVVKLWSTICHKAQECARGGTQPRSRVGERARGNEGTDGTCPAFAEFAEEEISERPVGPRVSLSPGFRVSPRVPGFPPGFPVADVVVTDDSRRMILMPMLISILILIL